jgi:hypothetical protein
MTLRTDITEETLQGDPLRDHHAQHNEVNAMVLDHEDRIVEIETSDVHASEVLTDGATPSDVQTELNNRVAVTGDTMTGELVMQDADIQINDPVGGATRGVRATWDNGVSSGYEGWLNPWGAGSDSLYSDYGASVSYWGASAYDNVNGSYSEMLPNWLFAYAEGALDGNDQAIYASGGVITQAVTWTRSGTTITVTTPLPHNFFAGQSGVTLSASSDTAALTNGSKTVVTAPTLTTFTITGLNAGATSGTATYTVTNGNQLVAICYDGRLYFGPDPYGATTPDVNLYRGNPNVLSTDDEFQAGEDIRAGETTKNGTDGLVLYSPDGTAYRVTVQNGGTLSIAAI